MTHQSTISEGFVERRVPVENGVDTLIAQDIGSIESLKPTTISCDWLEEARRQLEAIRSLPANWDTYSSPPPNTRWIDAAFGLLVSLCCAGSIPKPHINPTPHGGVQFEWEAGTRYLEIEIVAERAAEYFWRDAALGSEEEGVVFEGDSLDVAVKYIRRIAASQ